MSGYDIFAATFEISVGEVSLSVRVRASTKLLRLQPRGALRRHRPEAIHCRSSEAGLDRSCG